ncbi:hypothetical protein [Vibrio quintilis]|uniref:Uncharacterized protein n=1 Tax=Vibrio quintilis TaxID=1117707 RepID=A0A1M7YY57_9VIBR|nr:hypothetical protein [Vibrio quintilis]SHO57483.1 hypothetical protein VQ7734_03253 [Vibrio quintilis]
MKKLLLPLLIMPSLAFAHDHSTSVFFNTVNSRCSASFTGQSTLELNISNLSDNTANVLVQFYNKQGEEVIPGSNQRSDFYPGTQVSISANQTVSFDGSFYRASSDSIGKNYRCDVWPAVVKITNLNKNSQVIASGSQNTYTPTSPATNTKYSRYFFNINQGLPF